MEGKCYSNPKALTRQRFGYNGQVLGTTAKVQKLTVSYKKIKTAQELKSCPNSFPRPPLQL